MSCMFSPISDHLILPQRTMCVKIWSYHKIPKGPFRGASFLGGAYLQEEIWGLRIDWASLIVKSNAAVNVKLAWGRRAWGGDLTFFKNLLSNSLPTGKSIQSIATKFPHPGLHIAVNPKAEPKKGTIKISPNKTLQSFINVAASPKIHVPVTAAIIRSNHNPCYNA